jgi:hypothetical protein
MKSKILRTEQSRKLIPGLVAILCAALLLPNGAVSFASAMQPIPQETAVKIPVEQLDSLVAPIALYPDPLLSQTLVASTYPLEVIQLQQWLEKNKGLKDKALADAVAKQPWDPSIQAMAPLPDVVKRLADDIQWTTDLGNAFLAQQSEVMDAVQRMRARAQGKGALQSNEQQRVETQVVESKEVIVIEQSNPQVVYVPSYDPVYVYGPPAYPYPPIYYPPYPTGGVIAASAISFGVGLAMGAAWGGGWGWGCGWGGNDINVNMNNNFNRNTNISGGNRANISGGNKWQHNPTHRGGAPYGDRNTANRFGGTARGDSLANRQRGAQRDIGRQGGNLGSQNRGGISDRGGAGSRGGVADNSRVSGRDRAGVGDRSAAGTRAGAGVSDRSSRGNSGATGDRVGNRSVSGGSGRGAFGSSGGFNGSSARSSSSRGASSMGSRSGSFGGGSRGGFSGGGSRGGGGRGGGGRRR